MRNDNAFVRLKVFIFFSIVCVLEPHVLANQGIRAPAPAHHESIRCSADAAVILNKQLSSMATVLKAALNDSNSETRELAAQILDIYPKLNYRCIDMKKMGGGRVDLDQNAPYGIVVSLDEHIFKIMVERRNDTSFTSWDEISWVRILIHELVHVVDYRTGRYKQATWEQECETDSRTGKLMISAFRDASLRSMYLDVGVHVFPLYHCSEDVESQLRSLGFDN